MRVTWILRCHCKWQQAGLRLSPLGMADHQAVTNAAQLADLLSRADAPVVAPSG